MRGLVDKNDSLTCNFNIIFVRMTKKLHLHLFSMMFGLLPLGCGQPKDNQAHSTPSRNSTEEKEREQNIAELIQRAQKAYKSEDFIKATEAYSEAIRLNPNAATIYHSRGISWLAVKEYDKAIADFTIAIQLSPEYPFYYGSRAVVRYAKGEYDKAIADSSTAIQFGSDVPPDSLARMYFCRAMSHQANGNPELAIPDFAKGRELDPSGQLDPRKR